MGVLPSPESSPSLDPEDSPQPSRKRQRTDSPSHDPAVRSPRSDQMSSLTLADSNQDIDSYMAEQGEADIPPFMALTPPQTTQPMSPLDRVSFVEKELKNRTMQVGETWYLVAMDWWKRWKGACTGEVRKDGPISEQDLGPVDNASLFFPDETLLFPLGEGVEVQYVPEIVWTSFVTWYGPPQQPVPRRVIARGSAKLPSLELYPLQLKAFRLVREDPQAGSNESPFPKLVISAGETVGNLCSELVKAVSPNLETHIPYRVWKLENGHGEWEYGEYPSSQLTISGGKIIEESHKTLEEEGIQADDAFVVEFKQDTWIVEPPKSAAKSLGPPPLFSSKDGFFNKLGRKTLASSTTSSYKSGGDFYSGLSSKSSGFPLSTGKSITKALEPGTLGLGNMGNTCFMNSALQCLAHTKELSDYFLTGVFQDELNPGNPLGMGGAIAEVFGALLERIWATEGPSNSYSPREFKTQLQRFAPQFSGYQQHDSQELVAFLLDGLHEDLNRVLKKPYVEKPDWEGGDHLELVRLAQKSWEGYMLRNDSVIVDLFQGQYQSTLVCPECQKVSITFDPFMYLTLPLPVQKKWKHTIFYIPWDSDKAHVKIPVEINRDSSFKDLRNLLGRWMGVPADNLLTMEIFNHRFYKNLDDTLLCGDMSESDVIVCFELPCHAQQSRTYKKDPKDPFIVPVFLCDAKPASSTYMTSSRTPTLFGYPTVVVIDREQATNIFTMYDAVVARMQRWTTNARDLYNWEPGPESYMEEVSITLNGFPPIDALTEITEDGGVRTVESLPEEGDIVDEKDMVVDDVSEMDGSDGVPHTVGTKRDIFTFRLQYNHKELGTAFSTYAATTRWEAWDRRLDDAEIEPVLLREDDAFFCEFDQNIKSYFFGEELTRWEHARWDEWEEFIHPEYEESKRASAEKRDKGISLQDCLDEFTKEERLGEDDLWYCPRCKKHQQATKKFDLWKAPDILVVHLKRFSNSRALRDKIDAFIDFPIEGLDLSEMVGERAVAKKLLAAGNGVDELGLGSLDEPLVYDLFAVDEHMGGLGGGHYRAYASNHLTGKWYHFDDSYVSPASAIDAVNANAYLLFYRRRTDSPLGGTSHKLVSAARERPKAGSSQEPSVTIDTQLPTPPNESSSYFDGPLRSLNTHDRWKMRSDGSNPGSSVPSPPADDPPDFDESQSDPLVSDHSDPTYLSTQRFDFPDPSQKASPTSSTEADPDRDSLRELDDEAWDSSRPFSFRDRSSEERDVVSTMASPSYSELSDIDPYSDSNVQKPDELNMGDRKSVV